MKVSASKLRMNLKDYIDKSAFEDVIITNNGEEVAKLVSLKKDKVEVLNSLIGIVPPITDEEERQLKEERLMKI